ncbi:MAG: Do family serine endopeptidase [Bacteroidales bacterium]|nr:Do family serine endopeptidase [Bacteroidales bacterium]MDD2323310.1 Do family serine endopeptidase [Bacteroidales bacterium]MDD3011034.1 Do family serine endopeptidase [Bacteroidales bacterium]MDY0285877.1 Do family serine endopeptidase [Bacteroidales bacterium]HPE86505.1 Do family serine endopeptidase [Bacteroidales bacterium]
MKKYAGLLLSALLGGMIALVVFIGIADRNRNGEALTSAEAQPVEPQYIFASQVAPQHVTFPDLTAAAENSVHSVVHIMTTYTRKNSMYDYFFRDFFGYPNNEPGRQYMGSGSGVIISSDGYIVTNNHVVQDAEEIEVYLNDKRTFQAKLVGTDPSSDLAVIKIDETDLPVIPFGNADQVKVGEWVLAVGNPFNLNSTVTAGIVSAKARNIHILPDPEGGSALESFIQTDAAVNPGNSGGALVNGKGELIGVNAAIASGTGYYTGYSFAIPVSIVRKVTSDLIEFGEVQRAILGVSIREIDGQLADELGLNDLKGVYVAGLSDHGSAREAGIKTGDVITAVNNVQVNSTSELMEVVGQQNPGDKVEVAVNRKGKNHVYNVTLQSLKRSGTFGEIAEQYSGNDQKQLGAFFADLTPEDKNRYQVDFGVKVIQIAKGKLQSAGIKEGFVITHVDNNKVKNLDDFYLIMENKSGGVLLEGLYANGIRAYYGFGL